MVKKKKRKGNKGINLDEKVLSVFRKKPNQSLNYKQVSKLLKLKPAEAQRLVNSVMVKLASKGLLDEVRRGKYRLHYVPKTIIGTVDMTTSGNAFIVTPPEDQDVFVAPRNLSNALHGDLVEVQLKPTSKGKRPEGIIHKVLERKRKTIVGILEVKRNHAFLIPDELKIHVDIYIPQEKINKAGNGEKVIVRITDWPDHASSPFGEVIEILGMPGEHSTEMHSIMAEYNLPQHFPDTVNQEAEEIADEISKEEIKKRRDFRAVTTLTIDPDDAKDFDDALSFEKINDDTFEIGVHIADVTHYVTEGTALDKEAYHRGTSVYLVDRVIPMLPEKLSNKICSLRPNEEKLCFSAVFKMNSKAEIQDQWFGKTVIESDHRFTYEDAQKVIETKKGKYKDEILQLNSLAKTMRELRFKKGAINFDKTEVKFKLDNAGNPTEVVVKESKDAHKLIEEFMLLANRSVAEFVGKPNQKKSPPTFVYRVHDSPDPEKLRVFNEFVGQFGYQIDTNGRKAISKSLNSLLKDVKGKGEENMVEQLAIRSMSKAIYTTSNIGHYGLAFEYYSHFTSPIRRFPDMIVHRLLEKQLKKLPGAPVKGVENQCIHCSDMEKIATEAERASIKYKQVEFLKDKIGEAFNGVISGISEWGIYVEIIENKCEGMVRLRDLKEDYFFFDEKKYAVIGKRYGTVYRLGDEVFIRIKKADLLKKQLDFEIIET